MEIVIAVILLVILYLVWQISMDTGTIELIERTKFMEDKEDEM